MHTTQDVINKIKEDSCTLMKISSVAGSGKTFTAQQIVKELKPESGLYTAFNRAIVEDSAGKFPPEVECRTINSLAYEYYNGNIDHFTYLCIEESISYAEKQEIMQMMDKFFSSDSIDIKAYFRPLKNGAIAFKYISKMRKKQIPATFAFTVKYFHMMLHKKFIDLHYDMVIMDECQDASMVTLAIIKLINAPKKIFLGDPYQNLYSFMHTVNAFEIMKNEGVLMSLTQSYRVDTEIAKGIEKFGRSYMNHNFEFKGTTHEDTTINTRAYLSRTNSYLVARLIELQTKEISYRFLRDVKEIFALPLAVISANAGREVFDRRYKYLEKEKAKHQKLVDKGKTDSSFYGHMKAVAPNDVALTSAIMLVITNGPKGIYDAYAKAKQHEPLENAIVLATSFVSKGLTFDWVYIEDDLNKAVSKIDKSGVSTQDDLTVVFLYYVAASRARIKLVNAQFIEQEK